MLGSCERGSKSSDSLIARFLVLPIEYLVLDSTVPCGVVCRVRFCKLI